MNQAEIAKMKEVTREMVAKYENVIEQSCNGKSLRDAWGDFNKCPYCCEYRGCKGCPNQIAERGCGFASSGWWDKQCMAMSTHGPDIALPFLLARLCWFDDILNDRLDWSQSDNEDPNQP